jgi:hypothetical protein
MTRRANDTENKAAAMAMAMAMATGTEIEDTTTADAPKQDTMKMTEQMTPTRKPRTNNTTTRSPTNPLEELRKTIRSMDSERIASLRRRKRNLERWFLTTWKETMKQRKAQEKSAQDEAQRWNEMMKQRKTTKEALRKPVETDDCQDDNQPVTARFLWYEATTTQMIVCKNKAINNWWTCATPWTHMNANNYFWHRGRPPDRAQ